MMPSSPRLHFLEHRLENGLQLLVHSSRRVPLVHVSLHYRVGSSYEKPGHSGLAHLFEHMMFEGSENVGRNEHGERISAAGGSWNASTNKDRTNYYQTLPSHYLELALWLEADRMRSLKITPETFENQRRTVIEEKKQTYDNRPYGRAYLRFDELAYTNWAYGHPTIGEVEDLEKADLNDALDFHTAYYGPGNATLVIAGDVDEETAVEMVARHFGSIENRTHPEPPQLDEPEQTEEKRETLQDPLAVLPAVSLGYHTAELGSQDYYALSLVALVLSQGASSRLYRRLVYDNNWITGLYAGPNQYRGPELFDIWFQVQNGVDIETVVNATYDELQGLHDSLVPEDELAKARNQLAYSFVERFEKLSQVGEWLARYAVYFDDPGMINRELERFFSVTPELLAEAAARTFHSGNRSVLTVYPSSAPKS